MYKKVKKRRKSEIICDKKAHAGIKKNDIGDYKRVSDRDKLDLYFAVNYIKYKRFTGK